VKGDMGREVSRGRGSTPHRLTHAALLTEGSGLDQLLGRYAIEIG
jgi:hypothetical protein